MLKPITNSSKGRYQNMILFKTKMVYIYRYCMDFDHVRPDHECYPIEKVVRKHRAALQGCCDVLNEKQAKGEKSLKIVTDAEKALKKTAMQAKAELSKQKNEIQQAVEDVFQIKISKVDQLCASKEKTLVEQRENAESFLDQAKRADSLSTTVLKKGSDEEIIETRKLVEKRIAVMNESENLENLLNADSVGQNWFSVKKIDIEMVSTLFGEGNDHTVTIPPDGGSPALPRVDILFVPKRPRLLT